MTRTFLVLVILLTGFSELPAAAAPSSSETGAHNRQAVVAAAEALLKKFWPTLQQDRSSYGLSSSDTLETLSLGTPVQLQGIRDESIRSYQAGQSVAKIAEPTGHWFVPLVSQGDYRALIEVLEQGQGHWQGSGIGWAPLAKKWQAVSRRWPTTDHGGPMLLIVFSQPGYYLSVTSVSPPNLTALAPLNLDAESKVPDSFRLNEAAPTIASLKAAIDTQPAQ